MSAVYLEVISICLDCGYTDLYFRKHPQADSKSDINEGTEEEAEGCCSISLHPCGKKLGGRMRRTIKAVEPPKGIAAIGCEELA